MAGYDRGQSIRIVPERTPMYGMLHSWLLIESPVSSPVLNVELLDSAVFVFDVDPYVKLLNLFDEQALSARASRDRIVALMGRG